jgi:hypothetical protein
VPAKASPGAGVGYRLCFQAIIESDPVAPDEIVWASR